MLNYTYLIFHELTESIWRQYFGDLLISSMINWIAYLVNLQRIHFTYATSAVVICVCNIAIVCYEVTLDFPNIVGKVAVCHSVRGWAPMWHRSRCYHSRRGGAGWELVERWGGFELYIFFSQATRLFGNRFSIQYLATDSLICSWINNIIGYLCACVCALGTPYCFAFGVAKPTPSLFPLWSNWVGLKGLVDVGDGIL